MRVRVQERERIEFRMKGASRSKCVTRSHDVISSCPRTTSIDSWESPQHLPPASSLLYMSGQKSLLDFWTPKRKRDDSAEPKQKRSAKKTKTHVSTSRLDKAASASKKARSDIHKATVFKEKQVDAAANDDPRPADSSPIPGKDAIPSGSQLTIAPSTPRKKPLANSATYPSMPRTRKALHRAPTIIPETPQHIRDPPTPVTSNDINQTSPTRNKVALRSFSSLPSSFDDSEVIPSSQSQYIVFPSMPHRTSDPAESNSQLNSDEIVATSQSQEHDSDYAEYWKNRSPAKTKQASARNSR